MGYFYFDDSLHDDAGFITGALVYREDDLNREIREILVKYGMNPEDEEFKSSLRMDHNNELSQLRDEMLSIVSSTKIGLIFVPREKRDSLFIHCLYLLDKIIQNNTLGSVQHEVFIDQGIYNRRDCEKIPSLKNIKFHYDQDSKKVRGIQVADLAAHTCSMILKAKLGHLKKKKPVGLEYGYESIMLEDGLMDLDYFLWASIRRCFFQGPKGIKEEDMMSGHTNMIDYGLVISDDFEPDFRDEIKERFANNYLGCIH